MPWPNYLNLTDEDMEAILVFLKSTKPIKNLVPEAKQLKDIYAEK